MEDTFPFMVETDHMVLLVLSYLGIINIGCFTIAGTLNIPNNVDFISAHTLISLDDHLFS